MSICRAAPVRMTHLRRRTWILIALAAVALPLTTSTGQTSEPMISREFTGAVLGLLGMDPRTGIRVGVPADGLPATVVPSGGSILGTINLGTGSITIAFTNLAGEAALDSAIARVRASGFVPGRAISTGFNTGLSRSRDLTSIVYCRGAEKLAVGAQPSAMGGSNLLFVLGRVNGDECSIRPPEEAPPNSPRELMAVPSLPAPRDAVLVGGGGASRSGTAENITEFESSVVLKTSLAIAQVLNHYSERATAEGWKAIDSSRSSTAGMYVFAKTDVAGNPWRADLVVSLFSADSTVDVHFHARRRTN